MPLPLNQTRKRVSIGVAAGLLPAAAYAVPLELNIAASGGSPTLTMAPVRLTPRKNLRLLMRILTSSLVFTIIVQTPQKFWRPNQGDPNLFEVESRVPELYEKLVDGFLVRGGFQAAIGVAENLADHTFLAHRAFGQDASQLLFIGKGRVGQARNLPGRIERKIDSLRGHADRLLVAPAADRVEALESKTDRVHQPMAGRARRIHGVGRHALSARERLIVCQ